MIKLKVDSYKYVTDFIRNEKDLFFSTIIKSVTEGWKLKLDSVIVAEFDIHGDIFKIEIERNDWNESLHVALYYYEEIEKYEKCCEVRNLINNMYDEL